MTKNWCFFWSFYDVFKTSILPAGQRGTVRLAYAHRVPLNTFWRRSKTIRWKTWKNDEKLSWEYGNLQSRGVMRRLGHPQLSSGDHTVTHRYRGGILAHNCKALFYCALQLGGKKTSLEITFPVLSDAPWDKLRLGAVQMSTQGQSLYSACSLQIRKVLVGRRDEIMKNH